MMSFFIVSIGVPIAISYLLLFRFSFKQIRGPLVRSLLISFVNYLIWVGYSVLSNISICSSSDCYQKGVRLHPEGFGLATFGWGMIFIFPFFWLTNGILLGTKKNLGGNFPGRFIVGLSMAFAIWFIGALILAVFGAGSGAWNE